MKKTLRNNVIRGLVLCGAMMSATSSVVKAEKTANTLRSELSQVFFNEDGSILSVDEGKKAITNTAESIKKTTQKKESGVWAFFKRTFRNVADIWYTYFCKKAVAAWAELVVIDQLRKDYKEFKDEYKGELAFEGSDLSACSQTNASTCARSIIDKTFNTEDTKQACATLFDSKKNDLVEACLKSPRVKGYVLKFANTEEIDGVNQTLKKSDEELTEDLGTMSKMFSTIGNSAKTVAGWFSSWGNKSDDTVEQY